jgi:hypothetical protein
MRKNKEIERLYDSVLTETALDRTAANGENACDDERGKAEPDNE